MVHYYAVDWEEWSLIGARVVKTFLAVTISILIAERLDLYAYQFAGIIAVLSVQPSLYRSLRNGFRQMASAALGAISGAVALFTVGASFVSMGTVTLLLMALHVRIRWTNSLLVSVVIAINTMGTVGLPFWEAAINQIALVLIGTGVGTLVNVLRKPVHQERAEVALRQAEGMLRALLHYLALELERSGAPAFAPMKEQIEEVRGYIRMGSEISGFANEDRKLLKSPPKDTASLFQSFESMLDRIRDMARALSAVDLIEAESAFARRALRRLIRMQESAIAGKSVNVDRAEKWLETKRSRMWNGNGGSEGYYELYGFMREYARELRRLLAEQAGAVRRTVRYTSVDRPGLIAEVSAVLAKHGYNITNVAIRANGKFAATTLDVTGPQRAEADVAREILDVRHVLSVDIDGPGLPTYK